MKKLVLGVTAVSALAALSAVGCSSSSTPVTGVTPSDASTTTDDGGSVGDAATSTVSDAALVDSGCAPGATLYVRLGGHAGIRTAIDAIVGKELGDPDIVTYFFNQTAATVPAGHPNADQIEECFTDLLAHAAGGAESYPPDGGVTDDAGTFMCRADMTAIHTPLLISGGTFDKFITIAAGELATLGVCSADIGIIGPVLEGTKGAIVSASYADAGLQPFPGTADAASE